MCAGVAVAFLLGQTLPGTPAAHAHADPTRSAFVADTWQRFTSAKLQGDGSLSDIVGLSPTDVWAVGQQDIWDAWEHRSAIVHWDGRTWTQVGIRNDGAGAEHLRSIAAASPSDLWVVGTAHDGLPYIAHGDGTAFDRVSVDQIGAGDWLGGVDAVPGKVVAVGRRENAPLILTRSGTTWEVDVAKGEGTLYSVAISGKGEGWAVGDAGGQPLIMRLSGGSWKRVLLPRLPGGYLRDVHLDGPKRALAIGGIYHGQGRSTALMLAWNGKQWTKLKVPAGNAKLYGVTGDGKGRFYVSGFDAKRPGEMFLLRYDGRSTEIIRGGKTGARHTVRLQAVTTLPGSSAVWAVGHIVDASDRYSDVITTFVPKATKPPAKQTSPDIKKAAPASR